MEAGLGIGYRRTGFFVVGFLLAATAEGLLVVLINSISRGAYTPVGLGWITLPILAGTATARFLAEKSAEDLTLLLTQLALPHMLTVSRGRRIAVAGVTSWLLAVAGYVLVADPFGSYISNREWGALLKWITVPPLVAVAAWFLYRWANRKELG